MSDAECMDSLAASDQLPPCLEAESEQDKTPERKKTIVIYYIYTLRALNQLKLWY